VETKIEIEFFVAFIVRMASTNNMSNTNEDNQDRLRAVCGKLKQANATISEKITREENLLRIIIRSRDMKTIEDAFEGTEIPIQYYARESTYVNKRGHESKCWLSVYGTYCGTMKKKRPVLTFYAPYSKKYFKPNFKTEKMEYGKDTFKKTGITYQVYKFPTKVEPESDDEQIMIGK